jgi:soluble lytic murein transglycosylase-like protein
VTVSLVAGVLSRRRTFAALISGLGLLSSHEQAAAGRQMEEPLADSVRTALSSAIANHAPPVPEFPDTESRLRYLRWLGGMSERLKKKKPEWNVRKEFLQTLWYESRRAGLDPALVLGLVQVESNFRKFAVSSVGARGYMQVMPFWTRVLGDGDAGKLFHMQTNLRFGCVILRHYLDRENGNLFLALGRYNGSRGKAPYPDAVLGAKRLWEFNPG